MKNKRSLSPKEAAFRWMGVRLEVLDPLKRLEPSEELVQDLLTVVTMFAGRPYGQRARGIRKWIQTTLQVGEQETEEQDGTGQQDDETAP